MTVKVSYRSQPRQEKRLGIFTGCCGPKRLGRTGVATTPGPGSKSFRPMSGTSESFSLLLLAAALSSRRNRQSLNSGGDNKREHDKRREHDRHSASQQRRLSSVFVQGKP